MRLEQIEQRKREITDRHGPWTSHRIHLGNGLHTLEESSPDGLRLRRVVQVVADLARRPIESLRILDLACLEGLFATEFALRGAQVVGIEGREANVEKARLAKEAHALENLEFVRDDVRNLDRATYGEFDVVLCLGILYHLDAEDACRLMERVAEVCRGFAIVATHVSPVAAEMRGWQDRTYWGRGVQEHRTGLSAEEKLAALWYSLDNERAFHLTRPSLYNLLGDVGFTSVYECLTPLHDLWEDYVTLVAVKGTPQAVVASPDTNVLPMGTWPERPEEQIVKADLSFWTGRQTDTPRLGLRARLAALLAGRRS